METDTLNDLKTKADKFNPKRKEGKVAKAIESQTSKIPSDAFLWTAGVAMAASLTLKLLKVNHLALFIGQWAAPMLLFGIYNKMVKQQGHDSEEPQAA
jgi:hypothetical protein